MVRGEKLILNSGTAVPCAIEKGQVNEKYAGAFRNSLMILCFKRPGGARQLEFANCYIQFRPGWSAKAATGFCRPRCFASGKCTESE